MYSKNAKIDKYRYDHTKNFRVLFLKNLDKYLVGPRTWNSSNFYSAQNKRLKITKWRGDPTVGYSEYRTPLRLSMRETLWLRKRYAMGHNLWPYRPFCVHIIKLISLDYPKISSLEEFLIPFKHVLDSNLKFLVKENVDYDCMSVNSGSRQCHFKWSKLLWTNMFWWVLFEMKFIFEN
jgi:hypothetical protein